MKRYLVSFGLPLVIIYAVAAFVNLDLTANVAEWHPGSRGMAAVGYLFLAVMTFTWPGWDYP